MHPNQRRRLVAELAEGNRRAARSINCGRCGALCVQGDDHDDVAIVATVDAEALTPLAEMFAVLDGRRTYDLVRAVGKTAKPGSHSLYIREVEHVHSIKPPPGTVHATHRCPPEATP